MKITIFKYSILFLALVFLASCSKDSGQIGGAQSEFGEVGNDIEWTSWQFGVEDTEMYVSELEDGISTFVCSGTATNDYHIELLKMMPTDRFPGTFEIIGNRVEATFKAKVTDEGLQAVFEDGATFTMVKYDAEVGDKFSVKRGGVTLENEVVEKSTEDDYYWNGIWIKVIIVRYDSHSPGILYVEHEYNHKFGLVGIAVYFEDGTVKYASAEC